MRRVLLPPGYQVRVVFHHDAIQSCPIMRAQWCQATGVEVFDYEIREVWITHPLVGVQALTLLELCIAELC